MIEPIGFHETEEEYIARLEAEITRLEGVARPAVQSEEATLDAWVDSLPDSNDLWCGWHPHHGYGIHWGVHHSPNLIRLTEQNIRLGWEVRRVHLSDGAAQEASDPLAGLVERLDRLCLTSTENNRVFVLATESAKNIVEIVREWIRSGAGRRHSVPSAHRGGGK